jgi:hypothetical protein
MVTVSKPSVDRLDIELSGALGADEMRSLIDDLIEKSEGISHGKMLYTISDFEMPSMGAIAVEFQQMPKLFSLIGKFEKCAVLSDASWIRTAAEIEGAVIPSLRIKSFPLSARKAAEDWLEGRGGNADSADEENFPV